MTTKQNGKPNDSTGGDTARGHSERLKNAEQSPGNTARQIGERGKANAAKHGG